MHGKEKCRILREVRRMIAQANDIPFASPECAHEGPCFGTCPQCEAELRYLERQLRDRQAAGQEIELRELFAGVSLSCPPESSPPPDWEVPDDMLRPPDELAGVPVPLDWESFSDTDF